MWNALIVYRNSYLLDEYQKRNLQLEICTLPVACLSNKNLLNHHAEIQSFCQWKNDVSGSRC
jgi:hypothetical protein